MSEKKRGSIIQKVISALLLIAGLAMLADSFSGGLLLILGGIILFPKIGDMLLEKFEFLSKNALFFTAFILFIISTAISKSARETKKANYLKEHPEVAERLAKEKVEKEDEANNRKFKRLLIDRCKTPLIQSLKDPSSLEIDRSSVNWTRLDEAHLIEFRYTAKNSFNAKVREKVRCEFDNFANLTDFSDGSKPYIPKKTKSSKQLGLADSKKLISDVYYKSTTCKSYVLLEDKLEAKKCGVELFEFLKEGSEYMTVTRDILKKTENDSQLEQSPEYKSVLNEINETIENTNIVVDYLK